MIEKISTNVDEVKKKHSEILSAPQTEDSVSLPSTYVIYGLSTVY